MIFVKTEIETKFKIDDLAGFRKRLRKMKAKRIAADFERDIYYQPVVPRASVEVIRLRTFNKKKGLFTIKNFVLRGTSKIYKIRRESEVAVGDPAAFDAMLRQMGFEPVFKKEKKRETYAWKKSKILLDRLPYIGWYVEIEGSKKDIRHLAGLLSLDIKKAMVETYIDLFKGYKLDCKKPNLQMTFAK